MSVTFTQLAYFLAVADVRSFTRAAESVGVAQPTLSRQLKALETELGAELVDRGARDGPVLTPAGEALLPLARRMLADADSARTAVAEIVGLRSGRVRVGATPSLCIGVLAGRSLVVPRRGYDVRETTLQAFADAGVEPRFAVEGGEMDAVLRMVEAGTGVAVVPDLVFAR